MAVNDSTQNTCRVTQGILLMPAVFSASLIDLLLCNLCDSSSGSTEHWINVFLDKGRQKHKYSVPDLTNVAFIHYVQWVPANIAQELQHIGAPVYVL